MKTCAPLKNRSRHFLARAILCYFVAAGCLLTVRAESWGKNGKIGFIITQKTFPLYNYISNNKTFAKVVQKDYFFKNQTRVQEKRLQAALTQCADAPCYAAAAQWTPEEVAAIGERLKKLAAANKNMRPLPRLLRQGERYKLYETQTDPELLSSAWKDAAAGVNRILDVYIKGKRPRYPAIDSISFTAEDAAFRDLVRSQLDSLAKQTARGPFFTLPLQFALKALEINGRDEAARYEPLEDGMNRTAVARMPSIPWNSFPYSLLLVPGQGPDKPDTTITPLGMQRCRAAAEKFKKGLAPLIVVSGGHVHPNKTRYSEAVEMKKYMVQELGIPENAILIDPHARHTTTNMRNAARMVYRFRIPEHMKILIVTDTNQNSFISKMEKRFMDELKCLPYRELKLINAEESEFYPAREALQANPEDPLDP